MFDVAKLAVNDDLNLYLVSQGIKPATIISLDPVNKQLEHYLEVQIEDSASKLLQKISPAEVNAFCKHLDELCLFYSYKGQEYSIENMTLGRGVYYTFKIGKDKPSLQAVVNASTDEQMGLACGYPLEAVRAFNKVRNGEFRNGTYLQVCIAKAKKAGIELPMWLAYISHVPEELDFLNGNISKTSKLLGEKYQLYVSKNNPELAKKVETLFLNMMLPENWEKLPDGKYKAYFADC